MTVGGNKLHSCDMGGNILVINLSHQIKLKDFLYCPELQCNLLSVKRAAEKYLKVIFEKHQCNFVKK